LPEASFFSEPDGPSGIPGVDLGQFVEGDVQPSLFLVQDSLVASPIGDVRTQTTDHEYGYIDRDAHVCLFHRLVSVVVQAVFDRRVTRHTTAVSRPSTEMSNLRASPRRKVGTELVVILPLSL
jgi:hypothetical protein